MLKNTFAHIPGIGVTREQNLWKSDILTWAEFVGKSESKVQTQHVQDSIIAYNNKDYHFFANALHQNLHWRTYRELKDQCCFLDIETTGLSREHADITLIGLYDGKESKFFIKGKNMHEFPQAIEKYPMMVTFNGRCFDLPFIKTKFPKSDLNKLHVDLRFALKDLGYRGGLKRIEQELGVSRDAELKDIDGFEAVRLWRAYERGDKKALELLLHYNKADIENLKFLADFAFENLRKQEFLQHIG